MTNTCLCEIPLSRDCVIVFDLDDTLFLERDFVRSGFREVARALERTGSVRAFERMEELFCGGDVDPIGAVIEQDAAPVDKSELLRVYREHEPKLRLAGAIEAILTEFVNAGRPLGIITDGRSLTQRNKIRSLGLGEWISEIIISEEFGSAKPAAANYCHFEKLFPNRSYAYVGDNISKDFVTPNRLGWTTIGVRNGGQNIHSQWLDAVSPSSLPHFMIEKIA